MAQDIKATEQSTVAAGHDEQKQKAKVTLYWLSQSRSQRILWLLEELKVDCELKTYQRQHMLAPEELKKVHPLGKSPIITIEADALAKPLILAESGLIVEYLIDHFGPYLAPKKWNEGKEGQVGGESEEWIRYRYFMHYAEGSYMILLVVALLVGNIRSSSVPFFLRPITNGVAGKIESMFLSPNFKTHLDFLESQLATSPHDGEYLCGREITGADIMMSFPLEASKGLAGLTQEKYPRLWVYVEKLEARDAYKRAVQRIIDAEGFYKASL
ncbi:hypothetical protein MMC30_005463 [Trapelia coarctata]|nr:hypothetical protein [Trapelia coarctata]